MDRCTILKMVLDKHWHWLAVSILHCLVYLTVFGTGNATQVNTITTAINSALLNFNIIHEDSATKITNLIIGIIVAVMVAMILSRRCQTYWSVSPRRLIPFMALFYIVLAIGVDYLKYSDRVPGVFCFYY